MPIQWRLSVLERKKTLPGREPSRKLLRRPDRQGSPIDYSRSDEQIRCSPGFRLYPSPRPANQADEINSLQCPGQTLPFPHHAAPVQPCVEAPLTGMARFTVSGYVAAPIREYPRGTQLCARGSTTEQGCSRCRKPCLPKSCPEDVTAIVFPKNAIAAALQLGYIRRNLQL